MSASILKYQEDDVFLGPSVVFTNIINPRSAINRRNEYEKRGLVKVQASVQTQPLSAEMILGHTP